MYIGIFCDKKRNTTHLWDSEKGYSSFPTLHYAYRRKAGGSYTSLYGDELEKITSFSEDDPTLFEGDLSPELRTLLDLYPNNDEVPENRKIVVIDIEVDSEGGFPNVDEGDKKITAIALYDKITDHYYSLILDPDGKIIPTEIGNVSTWSFRNEELLLDTFLCKWEEINPNIVTGWASNKFDMPYIYHRIVVVLGRHDAYRLSSIKTVYQNTFTKKMVIAGVSCMDYIDLYKKFLGVMKPSYTLSNVAKDEDLPIKKLTYKGSLNDLYKNDLPRYVEYNLTDVKVVVELDKKYDFIYLACAVCHKGRVPYEWFQMSSRWIDGAILNYLHSKNLVAPNKPSEGREEYAEMEKEGEDGFTGAFVKEPIPGLYDWIYSADITSLYPSAIMSLNISSETKLGKIEGWDRLEFDKGNIPEIKIDNKIFTAEEFKKMISNYEFSISSNGVVYKQPKKIVVCKLINY